MNFILPNEAVLIIQSFQPTSCSMIHNGNSCFKTQTLTTYRIKPIIKEQIKLQYLINKSVFHVPPLASTKFNIACLYNSFWNLPSVPPHQPFIQNIIFQRKKYKSTFGLILRVSIPMYIQHG